MPLVDKTLFITLILGAILFMGCTGSTKNQTNLTASDNTSLHNATNTVGVVNNTTDRQSTENSTVKTEPSTVVNSSTVNPVNSSVVTSKGSEPQQVPDTGIEGLDNVANQSSASDSSNLTVKICQVIYDPPGKEPDDELIKLCNPTGQAIDVGGWTLTDGEGTYQIPQQTIIAPKGEWQVKGTTFNPTGAPNKMALSNKHDSVKLIDENGKLVDEKSW